MIKSLENPPNQPSKFRTKNWVEIMTHVGRITPIAKLNLKLQY